MNCATLLRVMQAWALSIGVLSVAGQALALSGLAARGRLQRVIALPVYLAFATLAEGARLCRADIAMRWDYWAAKELALGLLMAGMIIEISIRVFARLSGARSAVWAAIVAVVACTAVAIWSAFRVYDDVPSAQVLVLEVLPRLAVGCVMLCVCTVVAMAHYRVPLDPLHRAVVCGLALFLAAYAGPMGSADEHAFGRHVMYNVTPLAYLAVVAWWAWAAWRVEAAPDAPPEVVAQVQPWR